MPAIHLCPWQRQLLPERVLRSWRVVDLTSDILGSIFKTSRFSGSYAGNGSASAKMALSLQALLLYVRVVIVIVRPEDRHDTSWNDESWNWPGGEADTRWEQQSQHKETDSNTSAITSWAEDQVHAWHDETAMDQNDSECQHLPATSSWHRSQSQQEQALSPSRRPPHSQPQHQRG